MLFVSLTFLFLFLPCTLAIYFAFLGHRTLQNIILLFVSLFFYAWGEPCYVAILILSILINWAFAMLIGKENNKNRKTLLVFAIIVNLSILFLFKYLSFTLKQLNLLFNLSIPIRNLALPIGISFYTFQALSYVVDVYRGEKCQKNPLYVGLYIAFFPQLIAGPIVRYNSIAWQIDNRRETIAGFKYGAMRFLQGFSKKVLLANTMAVIADKAFQVVGNNLSVSFSWLGALSYSLQIFFDFSAYSDMAIGLSRMFGFNIEENFNYPYTAVSITDFWKRWHISLSTWFRDYVYIPLGGSQTGNSWHNYFNLFTVWILTGIWHGANWTFVLWGILYFVVLLIEKATRFGKLITKRKWIGHIYTLLVVSLLWVLFRSENIQQAKVYVTTMFGISNVSFYSEQTGVYIKEYFVYLISATLVAAGIAPVIKKKLSLTLNAKVGVEIVYETLIILLFVVSIVYVVNGSYNPFIYFNF